MEGIRICPGGEAAPGLIRLYASVNLEKSANPGEGYAKAQAVKKGSQTARPFFKGL
jgi:hypothetical protein